MSIVADMLEHAREAGNNEVCGLVVSNGRKQAILRGKNISAEPHKNFDLDPEVWLRVPDGEDAIGIYHSHPVTTAKPSPADLTSCELTGLPWHIVNPQTEEYVYFEPSGYRAPYTRRPYVHGVLDCYSIIRDWWMWERGVELPNFHRDFEWWEKGQNLYVDNFAAAGFVAVKDQDLEIGDVLLLQYGAPVPNHAAIYIGVDRILHHAQNRLSVEEPYGGIWQRHTTHHLRHVSTLGASNG